jgi:hypothetical protein
MYEQFKVSHLIFLISLHKFYKPAQDQSKTIHNFFMFYLQMLLKGLILNLKDCIINPSL